MSVKVTAVPMEGVLRFWPKVRPFMEEAAKYTNGRYDVDDIFDLIVEEGYQLWIAFTEEEVKGAVVTCFAHYPQKIYLNLMFCGGKEGMQWKDAMLNILQCWAYDNNCDGLEASARFGWQKIFKNDGYKPLWQIFELPTGEAGLGV